MIKKIMKKGIAALLSAGMILGLFPNSPLVEAQAATTSRYETLTINRNSLNGNAIWGLTESWGSDITLDESAAFYATSSNRNAGKGGLPVDGVLNMPSGVPYKLASGDNRAKAYDGNDCIRLYRGQSNSTMNLETIGVYNKIYVLATAGGPGNTAPNYAKFKVTLNYTDGTSADKTYKLYDWYYIKDKVDGVEQYYNVQRRENSNSAYTGVTDSTGGPILQSATIESDPGKLLKSITFTLLGLNETGAISSNLYCGIFAVTGATPAGVPDKPNAIAASAVHKTTDSPSFQANWEKVDGATGYLLDVSTNKNFTDFVTGTDKYNNLSVGNVTSRVVSGLAKNTTYYYRVRAKNSYGQSLSSNRIATGVPKWASAAGITDDQATYDVETDTLTITKDTNLSDTINVPTGEKTTIVLTGNSTVTAPTGKTAIKASGTNTALVVSGDGKIVGGDGTEGKAGSPAIDISDTSGNSKLDISGNATVIGGNGGDAASGSGAAGGAGGAAIKGNSNSSINIEGNGSGTASAIGGNGGNGAGNGNGGDGGSAIDTGSGSSSNVTMGNASLTGGDGGKGSGSGKGGNGGNGTSNSNVTANTGNNTIVGGAGGNGGSTGAGGNGGNGVSNGSVNAGASTGSNEIRGGAGGDGGTTSGAGGAGGNGTSNSNVTTSNSNSTIFGGNGGNGSGTGAGGAGGNGTNGGTLDTKGGSVSGGAGGSASGTGNGGAGGNGVNNSGVVGLNKNEVNGGAGGSANEGNGGAGGTGVSGASSSSGKLDVNNSNIAGGTGGSSNAGNGGDGGNGVSNSNCTMNSGTVTGGTGGNGGSNGNGGNGGNGTSGSNVNASKGENTITGGAGGEGSGSGAGGAGGNGVSDGKITSNGATITGGAGGNAEDGKGGAGGSGIENPSSGSTVTGGSSTGGNGGESNVNENSGAAGEGASKTGDIKVPNTSNGQSGHKHTYNKNDWEKNGDYHCHVCSICGEEIASTKAAHTGKWIVETPATKEKPGKKIEKCTVCGYQMAKDEIPQLPKDDSDKLTDVKQNLQKSLPSLSISNGMTEADIKAEIEEKIKTELKNKEIGGNPEITIDLAKTDATKDSDGKITGTITIKNGDDVITIPYNKVIPKIDKTTEEKLEEATGKLENKLGAILVNNDSTPENIQSQIEKILREEGVDGASIGVTDLNREKATNDGPGKMTGTITVTVDGETKNIPFERPIPKIPASDEDRVAGASDIIGEQLALGNPKMTGKSDEQIKQEIKEMLENAGYTGVEPDMTDVIRTEPSEDSDGNYSGNFVFKCGDQEVTLPFSQNLPATGKSNDTKVEEAKQLAESALSSMPSLTNQTTIGDLAEAIQKQLEDAGLTDVSISTDGLQKESATSQKPGSISGTLTISCGGKESSLEINQVIPKLPSTDEEKKEQVRSELQDKLSSMDTTADTSVADIEQSIKDTLCDMLENEGYSKEDAEMIAGDALEKAKESTGDDKLQITSPTKEKEGSVTGKLDLNLGDKDLTIDLNQTIPKLEDVSTDAAQKVLNAANLVKDKLNNGKLTISSENRGDTDKIKEAAEEQIIDLLKKAGYKTDGEKSVNPTFNWTTVTPATDKKNGELTGDITFVCDGKKRTITVSLVVPKVTQTEDQKKEEVEQIKNALQDLDITDMDASGSETDKTNKIKEDLTNKIKDQLKQSGYSDSDIAGATIDADGLNIVPPTSGTKGSVTGNIKIKIGDEELTIPVDKDLDKLPKSDKEKVSDAKDTIKNRLPYITASNDDKDGIGLIDQIKKDLEKQGITDVEVILKNGTYKVSPANTEKNGLVTGTIEIKKGNETISYPFEKVIPKITNPENPESGVENVKQDVIKKLNDDLNNRDTASSPVTSQKELQEKMDELLKDSNPNIQDVVVKDFKYTEPAQGKSGKIEGTITVTTKSGQEFDVPYVERIPYVMSDEEMESKTGEIVKQGINKPSNETSASDILKEMEKTLKENGITDATITMKDYKKTDATSKKEGQISGTMKVTLKDGTSFEIPYEQQIPKLTQKSAAEIKESLKEVKRTVSNDFKPVNSTTKETFIEAIRKQLEQEGLTGADVEFVKDSDSKDIFQINQATETSDGTLKAKIKVVSGKTSVTWDFTLNIPKIAKEENGSGSFTVEGTEKQVSAPQTNITSSADKVKEALPGIETDQDVNVYLKVEAKETTPEDRARQMIEEKAESENVKVDQYVDISMIRKVTTTTSGGGDSTSNETETNITNLNEKIELQIVIPENLRAANRTYTLLHYHDGDLVAEVVEGTYDPTNYTFTFWTDKFSTYAIAYTEQASSNGNNSNSTVEDQKKLDTVTEMMKDTLANLSTEAFSSREELEAAIKKALEGTDSKDVTYEIVDFDKVDATAEKEGKVTGKIRITVHGVSTLVPFSYTIEKLKSDKHTDQKAKVLAIVSAKAGDKKIELSWEKVAKATGYEVYASVCNGGKNYKKVATTKKLTCTVKNLNNKKTYKFYVRAYKIVDGKKVYLSKSVLTHVAMKDKKYTNVKAIQNVRKSYVLNVGKKAGIRGRVVKEDKFKKLLAHAAKFRYYSSDTSVATVSENGVVTAQQKGKCYIYVVTVNGVYKRIKITVK